MSDDKVISMRPKSAAHTYDIGRPPSERKIPVEANDTLKTAIMSEPGDVGLEHAVKLHDLYLAAYHEEKKRMLFGNRADSAPMADLLDRVLNKSLDLLQHENVTVVGIILDVTQTVIEHPLLQKHVWGPMLYHNRGSAEILAEINLLSKSLAGLQIDFDAAREREKKAVSVAMVAMTESPDDAAIYVQVAGDRQGSDDCGERA